MAANALLQAHPRQPCSAADYFAGLRTRVGGRLSAAGAGGDSLAAAADVLRAGVACLEGFMQANLCGCVAAGRR